jgi:hypothetical protein
MCYKKYYYIKCLGCNNKVFSHAEPTDCNEVICFLSKTHPPECLNRECRKYWTMPDRIILREVGLSTSYQVLCLNISLKEEKCEKCQ